MTVPSAAIEEYGDTALLVSFGSTADDTILARVHGLAAVVRRERDSGVPFGTPVPGLTTLMVPYDPHALAADEAVARLSELVSSPDVAQRPTDGATERIAKILVRYGGPDGPDLADVAERCGLTPAEVVDIHASIIYRVQLLGFMPGFAYLGALPPVLVVPRRDVPRSRVPAGSVAIAGRQTAVYPFESPGGWHLIGRTEAIVWDAHRDPPALLQAGDRVRFVPQRGS